MNYLALLSILLCCGGNRNCNGKGTFYKHNCERRNGCRTVRNAQNCNMEKYVEKEECDRVIDGRDCGCDVSSGVHSCPTAPMPRTKFPYLDTEPRTCGCEEPQDK